MAALDKSLGHFV